MMLARIVTDSNLVMIFPFFLVYLCSIVPVHSRLGTLPVCRKVNEYKALKMKKRRGESFSTF